MSTSDPFAPQQPLDPFAPQGAAPLAADDNFAPVENSQDNLDRAQTPRVVDAMQGALADVPEAEAKGIGDKLRTFATLSGAFTQLGKKAIRDTQPFEYQGKLTDIIIEESTRPTSALLEQTGKLYSDLTGTEEGNNLLLQTGLTIREGTKTPEAMLEKEALWEKFARGFAQTGAFVIGGKVISDSLKQGRKTAGAVAAWLGSAVGGQAGREDAQRHGAEDWQVDTAYYLNSAFGLSEGLPIGIGLGRLDELTGGILSRKFKGKLGEIASAGSKGFIEEALQESFQTFGENWTAQDLAAYDPTRSLSENIMEAAAIGGSTGMLLNMIGTALGIRNRQKIERELKEKVLDPIGVNSLDEIAGPFVTIDQGYNQLIKKNKAELDAIRESAESFSTELATETAQTVLDVEEAAAGKGKKLDFKKVPKPGALNTIAQLNKKFTVETTANLQNVQANANVEGKKLALERIQQTPVVAAITAGQEINQQYLKRNSERVAKLKEDLKDPEKADKKSRIELEIKTRERRIKQVQAVEKARGLLARDIKSLYAKMLPMLPEGTKVLFTDTQFGKNRVSGSFHSILTGKKGEEINTAVIHLDTSRFFQHIANREGQRGTDNFAYAESLVQQDKEFLFNVALHEFGHAIAYHNFHSITQKQVDGTATQQENELWDALRADYFRHVQEVLTSGQAKANQLMYSLPRAREIYARRELKEGINLNDFITSNGGRNRYENVYMVESQLDYLLSMSEFFAEGIAQVATNNTNMFDKKSLPFFKESIENIEKALARVPGKFAPTSKTLAGFIKNFSTQAKMRQAQATMQKEVEHDPLIALAKDGVLEDMNLARALSKDQDRFNKFMDWGFNILQLAEQNPHIQGLQNYVQNLRAWKNEVNNNLAVADVRLTDWKNLGRVENEKLSRALLDETIGRLPDGGFLKTPRPFTSEELAKYNLSEQALQIRADIKEDFRKALAQMEEVLVAAKKRIFKDNLEMQEREVAKVEKEFREMKARPYFPLMRFGEYTFQIRANGEQIIEGKKYKDGDIVEFQSFDTKKERDRAAAKIRRIYNPEQISLSQSKMITPSYSLQGMPMTLIEHLETKLASSDLDEKAREAIKQVKNDVLPFKSFRKQFQRRKRVAGFSFDAQRSYANYMTSFSNHIARVKYDSEFKKDFDNVQASISAINSRDGGDSTKRAGILNHMNEHMQYVMNPVEEFVGLRSAAFFWFLGFNAKSAFVNLTQIPLVTYPYLASRFGDSNAVAQLTRAYKTAVTAMRNPKILEDDIQQLIEQGMNESWLDESLATELALAASEKNLDKSLPRKFRQQAAMKISYYGSLPFHVAEKMNRHVTAIAAYRLAKAQNKGHDSSVIAARDAVEKSQYEYARWARPKFMRGKVRGTVFVFQNYMQNTLYFALGGDPGAMRMMLVLFLVAGLQGLPFGENLMDLFDAGVTALKEKTGAKDPNTQIRVELRQILKDLNVNPDLILHGTSSSTFGLSNIGEFMGWPIPDLDLSGSLSMGRIVPGTEMLAPGQSSTAERVIAQGIERTGGAIVSAFMGTMQALFDSHPDQWKRWERAMPAAMRNFSKAARMRARGGEFTRGGNEIATFDETDTRDHAELVAQALGFTPRDVSKGWEGFIATQQSITYYETWKTSILRQWNYAKFNGDEEAVKEANQEIRAYNKAAPFPELKIGPKTRRASYSSYVNSQNLNRAGVEQSKAFRRLSNSTQAVFEDNDN